MKKFLLLTVSAAISAAPMSAYSFLSKRTEQTKKQTEMQKTIEKVKTMNEAAANGIWQPGKVENYTASYNAWVEEEPTFYTYYDNGYVKTETQQGVVLSITYDDLNRVSTIIGAQEQTPEQPLLTYNFSYDPIVPNALVKTVLTMYSSGMTITATVGADVTRNADGNITNVDIYQVGTMSPKEYESKMSIQYGPDGKANTITTVYYDDGDVDYTETFSNIVWENTNGQIFSTEMSDDSYESGLFWGANRAKSFTAMVDDMPGVVVTAEAAYRPDGYKLEMKFDGSLARSIDYTKVDDYGSYNCIDYSSELDINDVTGAIVMDDAETETTTYRVDSWGLLLEDTEYTVYEKAGKQPETYTTIGHVDYNTEFGYPEEYWTEEGYNTNPMRKVERHIFLDYDFYTTAVKTIGESDMDLTAPAEYFNLQGVRVLNPEHGIYIMRQGDKTVKIMK